MYLSPISQVLLSIDKPLQEEIVTESGLKFYLDPTYLKEWNSSVTATIAKLPLKASTKKEQKILSQLKVGDEVAISYDVVADLSYQGDGERFMPATEGNEYMQSYRNGKGEKIDVVALPGKISKIWVGYYRNKRNELIDGAQGTEDVINRWKSQFQFGKTDEYSFNNFFEFDKKDYWKCSLEQIFAKKEKGHLVAVGDRIIMKPIEEDVPEELIKNIKHTDTVKIRYIDRGRIISGGKSKGLNKDQIISFEPQFLEKYTFWDKHYYLIHENLVLGVWQ